MKRKIEDRDGLTKDVETHVVVYKQAETKTKELVGRVACKLSAENYGASEWWLLLEPQA